MTYHDLSECTLTAEQRYNEALAILSMLDAEMDLKQFTDSEQSMMLNVINNQTCSVKQLFWLRDIKDKYL